MLFPAPPPVGSRGTLGEVAAGQKPYSVPTARPTAPRGPLVVIPATAGIHPSTSVMRQNGSRLSPGFRRDDAWGSADHPASAQPPDETNTDPWDEPLVQRASDGLLEDPRPARAMSGPPDDGVRHHGICDCDPIRLTRGKSIPVALSTLWTCAWGSGQSMYSRSSWMAA